MRNLFIYLFVFGCILSTRVFAQEMTPPKPLDNKVYQGMTGIWTSEDPMMGMPMHQEVNIHWALNQQYIIMDMTAVSKDNPSVKYNGMGIFGVDEKGNPKGWWFDDWGASAMSSGSGTFGENMFTLNDANAMFSETRTFELKDDKILMKAKGSMKINDKETPFEESMTYTKK